MSQMQADSLLPLFSSFLTGLAVVQVLLAWPSCGNVVDITCS